MVTVLTGAAISERTFQKQVTDLASLRGWQWYHPPDVRIGHNGRPNQHVIAGFPDLVLVHPKQGRILFVELKTAKGRVSKEQSEWHGWLTAAGQMVEVWRPADLQSGLIGGILR